MAMQQQQQESEALKAAAAFANEEFDALIAPLEAKAGRRLNGAGRGWCLRAFTENSAGFAACARDALERAEHSPLGLLVRMVRDGDHRLAPPSAPQTPPAINPKTGCTCSSCVGLDSCLYA
jgi:class 3 adenylate cyclase